MDGGDHDGGDGSARPPGFLTTCGFYLYYLFSGDACAGLDRSTFWDL